MSEMFLLWPAQISKIEPFLLRSYGVPRIDYRGGISGIVQVIKQGLHWKDAPRGYVLKAWR